MGTDALEDCALNAKHPGQALLSSMHVFQGIQAVEMLQHVGQAQFRLHFWRHLARQPNNQDQFCLL